MNYLIDKTFVEKAKEIVATWSPTELGTNYALIDKELDKIKVTVRERILELAKQENGLKEIEFIGIDGNKKKITISLGGEKVADSIEKKTDYEKAIKFAKDNGLEIPMTQPQVDYMKLESCEWFQENIEKFVEKKVVTKTIKSYDKISVKDVK